MLSLLSSLEEGDDDEDDDSRQDQQRNVLLSHSEEEDAHFIQNDKSFSMGEKDVSFLIWCLKKPTFVGSYVVGCCPLLFKLHMQFAKGSIHLQWKLSVVLQAYKLAARVEDLMLWRLFTLYSGSTRLSSKNFIFLEFMKPFQVGKCVFLTWEQRCLLVHFEEELECPQLFMVGIFILEGIFKKMEAFPWLRHAGIRYDTRICSLEFSEADEYDSFRDSRMHMECCSSKDEMKEDLLVLLKLLLGSFFGLLEIATPDNADGYEKGKDAPGDTRALGDEDHGGARVNGRTLESPCSMEKKGLEEREILHYPMDCCRAGITLYTVYHATAVITQRTRFPLSRGLYGADTLHVPQNQKKGLKETCPAAKDTHMLIFFQHADSMEKDTHVSLVKQWISRQGFQNSTKVFSSHVTSPGLLLTWKEKEGSRPKCCAPMFLCGSFGPYAKGIVNDEDLCILSSCELFCSSAVLPCFEFPKPPTECVHLFYFLMFFVFYFNGN